MIIIIDTKWHESESIIYYDQSLQRIYTLLYIGGNHIYWCFIVMSHCIKFCKKNNPIKEYFFNNLFINIKNDNEEL